MPSAAGKPKARTAACPSSLLVRPGGEADAAPDEDENGVDARETVPGLHDQRVQELESAMVDGSGHATFVTKNCAPRPRAIHSDGAARPLSEAQRLSRPVTVAT